MTIKFIFLISFSCFAFVYAMIAATTTIFYKNKAIMDLSHLERNILYGRATLGDRAFLFGSNLLASVIAPPIYILAVLTTFIYWIFHQ